MVMTTTGFGNQSTLGTQPLNNPEGYFGNRNNTTHTMIKPESSTPHPSRRQLPKFDMNLSDLFTEEEIASRPLNQQPKLQGFARSLPRQPPISPQLPTNASPQSNEGASQYSPHSTDERVPPYRPTSNNQTYPPAFNTDTIPQQPDYSFNNLDFLNDFVVTDPGTNMWGPANNNDLDLGLGSAVDGSGGAWETGDIFDTFFFGSSGNGY
ncbi:hypothetical protein HII31_10253 [Pseudocercospora fuligena]|uniref:Uncharacterized protein n=1 Tax=Pseudocercospora fuligena TaxID=685502 RepID=A0A8H6RCH9_9PEZI|nr:hypothetical protein HII31_10253 [Pseudocercospora fuligena]